jgi:hypothetical protein
MKLNRKQLRILIESIMSESIKNSAGKIVDEIIVPGYRDRPATRTYTVDHPEGSMTVDAFDAGSRIIVAYKGGDHDGKVDTFTKTGTDSVIDYRGGTNTIVVSSQR